MTDRTDQMALPALAMGVELVSTNGHLSNSDKPLSAGDTHVADNIEPSTLPPLPLALTVDGTMDFCGTGQQKATTARSGAGGLGSSNGTLFSEGIDVQCRPFDGNALIPPIPTDTIHPENQLEEYPRHDFWGSALADGPAMLDLPTDRPRPAQISSDLSNTPVLLDMSLTQSLKILAMDNGMDLGIVIMAGWSAVLSRLCGQDDIIIGLHSYTLGQSHSKCFEDRILPLRMDLSSKLHTTQLLGHAREMVLSVMTHQDLPPGRISDVACPSRGMGVSPIFQVALQWQSQESPSALKKTPSSAVHVDLLLQLQELDDEIPSSDMLDTLLPR
ncbi:hypothetical protein B0O80DRAFT_428567 [Mortierella sp. GBAus27b]|nr:hypothetical protein B0O80DRAFT_428567 [Mortierella sp. GBAus27b]